MNEPGKQTFEQSEFLAVAKLEPFTSGSSMRDFNFCIGRSPSLEEKDREAGRETDRRTDSLRQKQTQKRTDFETDRQTNGEQTFQTRPGGSVSA